MSQKLKQLKEKLRKAITQELVEYDNINTQKEDELEERLNLFVEKNTPTNPSKWSYYKSQAKKKFDVYPSAYANAWAAKQYKAAGGGWRKSENIDEASMTGNLDGGEGPPKTPYAFQSKKKRGQDKKKEDEISTNSTGFTKVNEAVDEGDFISAIQSIQAGLDEAEYGFNDLGRLKGMSSSEKRIVKTLFSRFKVLMKGVEKARRVITNESINEVKKQEVNALRNLHKGLEKLQKDYFKIANVGDKTLRDKQYNKYYETILTSKKEIGKLVNFFRTKQMLGEGRYHDWRNDESITPKQKIGRSMREVRDSLNGLSKTIDMSVKLKNELKVDTTDYWKTTHKALGKISERLVKLANKVGKLQ